MDFEETEARNDCAHEASSNLTDQPTDRPTDRPTDLQTVASQRSEYAISSKSWVALLAGSYPVGIRGSFTHK
jgi:hypothetical protein